jgi:dihydrolipoamide dehydrogenase
MVVGELTTNVDVAVIGGGPGGYIAAIRCAQLGLETVLIEKRWVGGECTNVGCIPSKALIRAADIAYRSTHSQDLGLSSKTKVDFKKMQKWKNGVVSSLRNGIESLCKSNGVDIVRGRAFFQSSNRLVVETGHGAADYEFKHAIIASGSVPSVLAGIEYDHKWIINSSDALSLKSVPKDLIIVGAGYIGIEMATMFAKLGSRVAIVYRGEGILRNLDPELGAEVRKRFDGLGIRLFLNSVVVGWKPKGKRAYAVVQGKEGKERMTFDKLLVAVGHEPYTKELGLEKTGVQLDEKGFIKVDAQRRTTDPSIFAVGDVAGGPMLAHKAFREGKVAAEAISGINSAFDNAAIPLVVFSEPEVASTGMAEKDAIKAGYKVKVSRFPLTASGRARTMDETAGFVKIVSDSGSGVVLGGQIAGPEASELISELSLAVEMGAQLEDIAATIHPHPTLSESVMESAEEGLGKVIHIYKQKSSQ